MIYYKIDIKKYKLIVVGISVPGVVGSFLIIIIIIVRGIILNNVTVFPPHPPSERAEQDDEEDEKDSSGSSHGSHYYRSFTLHFSSLSVTDWDWWTYYNERWKLDNSHNH